MRYFVEKLVWEYGEHYGDVYYPQNDEQCRAKLRELDSHALINHLPIAIEIFFRDDSVVGIIVGHQLLPKEQALQALFQYIQQHTFPSFIHFSRQWMTEKYASKGIS